MKRWERWAFNLLSLVVAITGCLYWWMKYVLRSEDPFAVVNHPWQASILNLHLLASPGLILMFGIILNSHIVKKLRAGRSPNRKSGLLSLGTFATMVISGYMLQVSSSEVWLRTYVALHVTSGVLFSIAYGAHLIINTRIVRASPRTAMNGVA